MSLFDPNETYFAMSRTAGERLREMGAVHEDAEFKDYRRTLIASLRDTATIIPRTIETHCLVRCHIKNDTIDREIALICVITKGSPAKMQKRTLLIRGAMSVEALDQLLSTKTKTTGMPSTKHDPTIGKSGSASKFVRRGHLNSDGEPNG